MSTSSLRRQMKNIVHNYSEAEIKVREATSNDPWGPSSSLMSEIADLTYNVVAFSEIMSMIWKRLNDHGKNWRHVYKVPPWGPASQHPALTTSPPLPRVASGGAGAPGSLREALARVLRAARRGRVGCGLAPGCLPAPFSEEKNRAPRPGRPQRSLAPHPTASSSASAASAPTEAEQAWPQSSGEEELQLQLALAMSKEEAEQPPVAVAEEDLQLQLALSLSREEHDKSRQVPRSVSLLLSLSHQVPRTEAAEGSERFWLDLSGSFGSLHGSCALTPGPLLTLTLIPPRGGSPAAASSDPWNPEGTGPAPLPARGQEWRPPLAPTGPTVERWGGFDPRADSPGPASDPWSSGPAPAPQGKPAADPWAPAQTFPDPWGGSPSKASTNCTAASGAFEPDEFSDFDSLRPALPKSGSSTGGLGGPPAASPSSPRPSGL
uniref:ENTH domain-containing protein n=1 Tax=Pelodiscus sinensis TaxID=13735 RepID=K7FVJ0_PELSI